LSPILNVRRAAGLIKRCIQTLLSAAHFALVGSESRRSEGNSALRPCICVDTPPASIHVGVHGKGRESGPVLSETLTSRVECRRCNLDTSTCLEVVALDDLKLTNGADEGF
jgi:hypothetical protein